MMVSAIAHIEVELILEELLCLCRLASSRGLQEARDGGAVLLVVLVMLLGT